MGTDIRVLFAALPDDAVIDITEFASLIKAPSVESMYSRNFRGELPPTATISCRRGLLWYAGVVRSWMRGEPSTQQVAAYGAGNDRHAVGTQVEVISPDRGNATPRRSGRPRRIAHISNAALKEKPSLPDKLRNAGLSAVDSERPV